jgi:hypothetical protein
VVGGEGWSTFTFSDQDGPSSKSSAKLDIAVIKGADRIYYTWAPDTGTHELSNGSVTYASDHQTVVFDVYAYDAHSGEKGSTHVTGSIICTP